MFSLIEMGIIYKDVKMVGMGLFCHGLQYVAWKEFGG